MINGLQAFLKTSHFSPSGTWNFPYKVWKYSYTKLILNSFSCCFLLQDLALLYNLYLYIYKLNLRNSRWQNTSLISVVTNFRKRSPDSRRYILRVVRCVFTSPFNGFQRRKFSFSWFSKLFPCLSYKKLFTDSAPLDYLKRRFVPTLFTNSSCLQRIGRYGSENVPHWCIPFLP
jgi:hypothetical protein